jgi:hypothetical protein
MSTHAVMAIVAFGLAELAMIVAYQLIAMMSDDMNRIGDRAALFDDLPRVEQIPVFMRHYHRFFPEGGLLPYLRAAMVVHLGGFVVAVIFLVGERL